MAIEHLSEGVRSRRRDYRRQVNQILRKMDNLESEMIRDILSLLRATNRSIRSDLANYDPEQYTAVQLTQIKGMLSARIRQFEQAGKDILSGAQISAWEIGIEVNDLPLESLGISNFLTSVNPELLAAVSQTGATLVTGVTEAAIQKISTAVDLAILGGQTPFQTAQEITKILGVKAKEFGGIAKRVDDIYRTEINRTFSISNEARLKSWQDAEPLIDSEWHTTIDGRERESHRIADGQIVRKGQPFIVGGVKMMFPLDPSAPAKEVVKCRCRKIANVDRIISDEN